MKLSEILKEAKKLLNTTWLGDSPTTQFRYNYICFCIQAVHASQESKDRLIVWINRQLDGCGTLPGWQTIMINVCEEMGE